MKVWHWLKAQPAEARAAFAGFILTVYGFFPGLMSNDSIVQYGQALSFEFRDGHPPLMSFLWAIFNKIIPGPVSMLIFHNVLFWSGLYLWSQNLQVTSKFKARFILMAGFFPPVFAQLGIVWKDVGLIASLTLATGMMLSVDPLCLKSRRRLLWALLPLFYGMGVRFNAAPALLMICFWWGVVWASFAASKRRWLLGPAIGVFIFIFLFVSALLANRVLTGDRREYSAQSVMIYDLVGISLLENKMLLPPYAINAHGLTLEKMRSLYSMEGVGSFFWPETIPVTTSLDNYDSLKAAWLEGVPHYFTSYLKHRAQVFSNLIGWGREKACYPIHISLDPNRYGFTFSSNLIYSIHRKIVIPLQNTPLFRAYPYLFLALCLLGYALQKRNLWLASVISSGLLYGVAYFVVTPSCELRYFYWTITSFWLGALFLGVSFLANRNGKDANS